MEIKIEPTSQHITWIVKNFFDLPQDNGRFFDSPEFPFSGESYCLRLYPRVGCRFGVTTEYHVRRVSAKFTEQKIFCKVGLRYRDRNGDEYCNYFMNSLAENQPRTRSILERYSHEFVPDGNLTVACSMWLSEERSGSSAQGEEKQGGFPGHCASFSSRWSSTKMEIVTEFPCTSVELSVPNFFELPREMIDSLSSPEFRFAGDTYCFRFQANGDTADTDLVLVRLTYNFTENTVIYRVGYEFSNCPKYPNKSRSVVGGRGFCISRSKLEEERKKYDCRGTLKMFLLLRLGEQSCAEAETSDVMQKRSGLTGIHQLQSDFREILQKETESDACVVVRGKEFKVHKVVLRARSKVFEAMFGHDTAEKDSGRVVIEDLDPDTFGDFLQYLYTGDVQDKLSDDNTFWLYAAADKYDVSTLKSECIEHMRRTVSVDSFCDVLTLALRHHEEGLLKQAIHFFKDNLQRIIVTAKWQQFVLDNGTAANELLIKAFVPGTQ